MFFNMSLNYIKRLYPRNNNVNIKKNATVGLKNVNSNKQFSQCPQAVQTCTLLLFLNQALFQRGATAVPNLIDRIKFDFSTAVARRLKPSRATAV